MAAGANITKQLLLICVMTLSLVADQRCNAVDHHNPAQLHEGFEVCRAGCERRHIMEGRIRMQFVT